MSWEKQLECGNALSLCVCGFDRGCQYGIQTGRKRVLESVRAEIATNTYSRGQQLSAVGCRIFGLLCASREHQLGTYTRGVRCEFDGWGHLENEIPLKRALLRKRTISALRILIDTPLSLQHANFPPPTTPSLACYFKSPFPDIHGV